MRCFEFDLQLPDGRILTAAVTSTTWLDAFSRACARVEHDSGKPPNSGTVCRAYRSSRQPGQPRRVEAD
jgi:hypothetical protein